MLELTRGTPGVMRLAMRLPLAVALSICTFAACVPNPTGRDPMRDLANKNAADCKANPALAKCKQASGGEGAAPESHSDGNVAVKLSNDCSTPVTFLFDGCGANGKRMFSVPSGGEKSVKLMNFTDGVTCDVCIAKGGDCKMMATMFTPDMSEASVSASGGCDSPSTH